MTPSTVKSNPTHSLTPSEVEFYRQNGYFLYHQSLFSPEKFSRLEKIFEEHLAEKGSKLSDELDTPYGQSKRAHVNDKVTR